MRSGQAARTHGTRCNLATSHRNSAAADFTAERLHVARAFCQIAKAEKSPKSGKVRSVPMADEVAQALARLQTASEFGVRRVGRRPPPLPDLRAAFRTAVKAAKLPPIRFHDLRHTFGTVCAASGIPLTTVQAYMGHAHISTTMVYAHFAPAGNEPALISRAFSAATAMPDAALPQAA